MSLPVWGMLAKSQTDDETIEEAIARLIAAHEADASAHLGAGESLENHKAATVLDHPVESIAPNKLEQNFFQKMVLVGSFQSLDAYSFLASESDFNAAGVWLTTSRVLNNIAYLLTKYVNTLNADFDKSPILEFESEILIQDAAEVYLGLGDMYVNMSGPFVGFKFASGNIYSVITDENGDEVASELIGSWGGTSFYRFRIEYLTGYNAKFYINNSLVSTLNNHTPDGKVSSFFCCYLKTLSTGFGPEVFLKPFSYSQNN